VQPVVGVVDRDEVGVGVLVDQQAVEPQHEVDRTATDEEGEGRIRATAQGDPGDPEEQVHDVVQDRDLEDVEELGAALVTGELHGVVVRGDAGDEAQDAHEQEDGAHGESQRLHQRAVAKPRRGVGHPVAHSFSPSE
jgi:hypothetical protein